MIRTGTCIDSVLPSGILPQTTTLVLARKGRAEDDLLVWVGQLAQNMRESWAVVRPEVRPGEEWIGGRDSIFISSVLESQGRPPLVPGLKFQHKTWLDRAVATLCTRILYGHPDDVEGTSLANTPPIVLHFETRKGGTHIFVERNDNNPKSVGWIMPFSDQPAAPSAPPSSVWELLGDDDF